MRKSKLLTATFLILNSAFLILNAYATNVPGGNLSGHWTLSGSPYNIMGSVIIPSDSTLTIDPGVTVTFQTANHLKMLVQGRILAVGTPTQIIHITAADHVNGFEGIRFNTLAASNDTSRFVYCDMQYGMDGPFPYSNGGALYINNWNKVIISHCIIKNCNATHGSGGAIYCYGSSPVITYNTITYNSTANNGGGAIYCENSTNQTILHNTISYNDASSGGGGGISCINGVNNFISYNIITYNILSFGANYAGGAGIFCSGTNTISYNTISNNSISGGQVYVGGGGICCDGSTDILHNFILSNSSYTDGGGIYLSGTGIISDNTISGNQSTSNFGGGGIIIQGNTGSASATISSNNITGNSAGGSGGGIYFMNCFTGLPCIISDNEISGNSAGWSGGGIAFNNSLNISITGNKVSNNSCGISNTTYGGGIYCNGTTVTGFSHNIVSGNSATHGGGLYCEQNPTFTSIDNSIFTNNSASTSTGLGGGIYFDGNGGNNIPDITNVTIANNNAFNGGGIYCLNTANPTFRNCIFRGNTAPTGANISLFDELSDPSFYYCDVQGGSAGIEVNGNFYTGTYQNNINTNPLFVAPSAGSGSSYNGTYNWTLQGTSPCRNTGDPGGSYPATDLGGNPRIAGPNIDMGAYEYQMTVSFTTTPISCNGGSNGTATAIVANGSPNYTYAWSNSQSTQTATGLSAGVTYTVTVTDALSATATATVTVTEPPTLMANPSATNASCVNNDGTASVSPSGGTAPYYYFWTTNGSTDSTITGLSSGNYTVMVTDTNNCVSTVVIPVPIDLNAPPPLDSICLVTVDDLSTHNIIVWEKPASVIGLDSFRIYREVATNVWSNIASVSKDSLSEYHDYGADPNANQWAYKISVLDSCQVESPWSLYHYTIHLQNVVGGNVNWDPYSIENSANPVVYYQVYRDTTGTDNFFYPLSTTIPGNFTNFSDGTWASYPNASYLVDVAWNISCTPTRTIINTTRSNIKHTGSLGVGINQPGVSSDEINIFPNPASNKLMIDGSLVHWFIGSSVSIHNVLGETIFQSTINNQQFTIDISGFAKGIYTIEVTSNNNKVFKKLVVE